MTRAAGPVTERDLLAFVDGMLDPQRRADVEAHLAGNPDAAATVAAYALQNERIAALNGAMTDMADRPPRLDPYEIVRRRSGPPRHWRMAAAASLVFVAGVSAGWFVRGREGAPAAVASLTVEALAAHRLYAVEVVHPVEVAADRRDHLQAWLSKRLDRKLVVPNLGQSGFRLVGGRLLPAGAQPAAQFMYEDGSGRRVTLYVVPGQGAESALRFVRAGALDAYSWTGEAVSCAVVGDLPRDVLHRLALEAYGQLE